MGQFYVQSIHEITANPTMCIWTQLTRLVTGNWRELLSFGGGGMFFDRNKVDGKEGDED